VWAAFTQSDNPAIPPLLYVMLPALVVWERDARARVMLGDAGSNPLGAALGLAAAQVIPLLTQGLLLIALIALHLLAERVSLTKIIESNRLLRSLDRLTGVR
jgi:UDP-N-acetylmuramyl pentapeptide phosphotransferase/UDP-N-acetylglucosamine-1-phosphate transferase